MASGLAIDLPFSKDLVRANNLKIAESQLREAESDLTEHA